MTKAIHLEWLGFIFLPSLKTQSPIFSPTWLPFSFFFSCSMVSKIIKVKVVGYVFFGLCHLPCLTELEFYEDENNSNCSKNPRCLTMAQGFCFYQGHIFVMNYLKSFFQLKGGDKRINWEKCYQFSLSEEKGESSLESTVTWWWKDGLCFVGMDWACCHLYCFICSIWLSSKEAAVNTYKWLCLC